MFLQWRDKAWEDAGTAYTKGCKFQDKRRKLVEKGDSLNLDMATNKAMLQTITTKKPWIIDELLCGIQLQHRIGPRNIYRFQDKYSGGDYVQDITIPKVRKKTRASELPVFGSTCNPCHKPKSRAKMCRAEDQKAGMNKSHHMEWQRQESKGMCAWCKMTPWQQRQWGWNRKFQHRPIVIERKVPFRLQIKKKLRKDNKYRTVQRKKFSSSPTSDNQQISVQDPIHNNLVSHNSHKQCGWAKKLWHPNTRWSNFQEKQNSPERKITARQYSRSH